MVVLLITITSGFLSPTDRPDMTESAFSVPKQTIQIETELIATEFNLMKESSNIYNANYFNILIKTGLFSNTDIHFGWEGTGSSTTFIRLHYSYTKQDFALGIIPFAKFNYKNDRFIQNLGLSLPINVSLGNILSIGAMYSITHYNTKQYEHFVSLSVGADLNDKIGIFLESAGTYDSKIFNIFINSGFVVKLSRSFQLDSGLYYNVTQTTITMFVGLSYAFSIKSEP